MIFRRRFWPEGFTRTPPVRAILDPVEPARVGGLPNDGREGQIVCFRGLTAADAGRLLDLLPPEQAGERPAEGAPSFGKMVALGERYPDLHFLGFRVVPERGDEAIVLQGFETPANMLAEILAGFEAPPEPPEAVFRKGRLWYRVWWD